MFARNEGTNDRTIRSMLGLVLIIAAFVVFGGVWQLVVSLIGLILLITGVVGFCPLYRLIGITTCPVDTTTTDRR